MSSFVHYETVPKSGIIPDLISNTPHPILSSILFLGLCSAIMSTMDSLVNTGARSLTVDVYKKYISKNSGARQDVNVGRVSTLLISLLDLFIALLIQSVLTI